MPGGNLLEYIKNNLDADRLKLVGVTPSELTRADSSYQLSDVAGGLSYLHSRNVIHGNLKGVSDYSGSHFITALMLSQSNILVDANGHARIADFRLTTVSPDADSEQTTSDQSVGSHQWTAPEVLEGGAISMEADIFSFAMVMIEVPSDGTLLIELWLTDVSCRYRYSLGQLCPAILSLLRPQHKASACHDRPIRASQEGCGG